MIKNCPSYKVVYRTTSPKEIDFRYDELVDHLINLYQYGKTEEFPNVFRLIEEMHHNVDTGVRQIATDILEGLQDCWRNRGADFKKYLLSASLENWNRLDKMRKIRILAKEGVAEYIKADIPRLLIDSCPSFKAVYEESEDKDLDYLIGGEFAQHLKNLIDHNKTEELSDAFKTIEDMHLYGCKYVQEFATIGILESLQNYGDTFKSYLLPDSLKWWNSLTLFWGGKIPYVGADIVSEHEAAQDTAK